ncbi:MAG: glucosaminidase domain-containing protein, partial [Nitrospirota bacterium]
MANYTMSDRVNFIRGIITDVTRVSNETGVSLEFILAQAALESSWGTKAAGNNLFGIKADSSWTGPTVTVTTTEWIDSNGDGIKDKAIKVTDTFRAYGLYEESVRDWLNFLQNNSRYSKVLDPGVKGDLYKAAKAIQDAGWATDPNYAKNIIATAKGPTMRRALFYYDNACWTNPYNPWLDGIFNPIFQLFTTAIGSAPPITRRDPLILDLDGDGIETTNVKDGAYFDYDGNGFSEQTGWAGADDGLLVMDRNGDGIINDGKELFGDQTILSNGQRASNGFQAL